MCWIKVNWNEIWMNWVVCGSCEAKWPLESHRGDLAVPHQVSVVCFNIDTHTGRLLGRWTHPVDSLSPKESAILRSPPTDPNFSPPAPPVGHSAAILKILFVCFFFFEKMEMDAVWCLNCTRIVGLSCVNTTVTLTRTLVKVVARSRSVKWT